MGAITEDLTKKQKQEDNQIRNNKLKQNSNQGYKCIFLNFTGYDFETFQSYENFTDWLHRPVDGSALGVFRMLYGAAMLIDIVEERGGSQLDIRFGEPNHCHFPLFNGIQATSFPIMGCIYLLMWLGACGIMLGYRFRLSCLVYILPYWYIFLLDKPSWNNHSYLFGLVGSILLFTQANGYCSLDCYRTPMPTTVPYWNYFLIKFQFFVLYMYAGLKKFTTEWLSGYAMSSLSHHWIFTPFLSVLSPDMTDLLVVHWFTAIFDFSIAFFMTWEKTRWYSLPFMICFHLMNSRLFIIGMFPWVCLAQVPMFFGFDWPRQLRLYKIFSFKEDSTKTTSATDTATTKNHMINEETSNSAAITDNCCDEVYDESGQSRSIASSTTQDSQASSFEMNATTICDYCRRKFTPKSNVSKAKKLRSAMILAYCALQLFLPYSHFITVGYNNWTNGLYGYSWDMMVHSYDTVLTSIKIVDNNNGQVHFLNPYAFTEYDRWTKYADMAQQHAKCIERNIINEYARDQKNSPLSSTNISIYFDIWCSMNGRFQQRIFDPRTDLLKAHWSPFERTAWSLPLLNELNHLRPRLKAIANEVLAWNNYSDVIFIADFPGLMLDNYIAPDLTNVTLTILEGNVRYKSDDDHESYFLTAGKSIGLKSDIMHHVQTIGSTPSCFMYTYVNKTMLEKQSKATAPAQAQDQADVGNGEFLPLWQELHMRLRNLLRFLNHLGNCLLFLLHGVPIPIELRERD